MPPASVDAYAAAFATRCKATQRSGDRRVDGPGIHGLVPAGKGARTQLLVHDDEAYDVLSTVLPVVASGTIRVYESAGRCTALLRQDPTWTPTAATGMVCTDLHDLPELHLPAGLSLRPVRRLAVDPQDGVPLEEAVAAAGRAAAPGRLSTAALTAYLRSQPADLRLFAAVDAHGTVCGTSGSGTQLTQARVVFVNTDPGWRRRGVGLAMTAVALRAAVRSGATGASLDASGPGVPLYERLGFATGARLTQFNRPTGD